MKRSGLVMMWGLALLLPSFAAAQSTTTTTTGTTDQTTTTGTQTTDTQTSGFGGGWMDRIDSHWVGSGFVGSNFGTDAEEAGFDFGMTLGYLWNGALGAEFQANFSPEFELDATRSALLFGEQPWINSYMFNAMAAAPLGTDGQWQPYVSAGFGALTLRADALQVTNSNNLTNEITPDDARGAGNIGVGVMGFMGNVGFRADVRYFNGFDDDGDDGDDVGTNDNDTAADAIGRFILSDLSFWRANIGVAFKW